jgi:hypothetical protein
MYVWLIEQVVLYFNSCFSVERKRGLLISDQQKNLAVCILSIEVIIEL